MGIGYLIKQIAYNKNQNADGSSDAFSTRPFAGRYIEH